MNPQLPGILNRIDERLKAVGLSDHGASKAAGLPDCIRSMRRACARGRGKKIVTAEKMSALSIPLKTNPHWLLTGVADNVVEAAE